MSFADLASIGSLISGIAVLVSLIYLSLETRQNTKHTRALLFQGSAELAMAQRLAWAERDLVSATIVGNGGTPTPDAIRQYQFGIVCSSLYISWDDFFAQYDEGLVSDEHYDRIRRGFSWTLTTNPGVREFMQRVSSETFSSDNKFHRFLRTVVDDSGPSDPSAESTQ